MSEAEMLRIRRATVEDAELLCRLIEPVQRVHVEARPDVYKPFAVTPELLADCQARLSDERVTVLIGEVEGEPIGYILAQVVEREDNPYSYAVRVMLVDQMSVNPEHRSKGYGEALMDAVFDLARERGIGRVLLTVWAFNERAISFYERQGFTVRDMRMEAILDSSLSSPRLQALRDR